MPKKKSAPKKTVSKKVVVKAVKKVGIKKTLSRPATQKDVNFLLILLVGFILIAAFFLGLF
jgi:hypothetical protein